MNKKLDAITAVKLAIKMWQELTETGGGHESWSGWQDNGGRYKHVFNDCFLCQYVLENNQGIFDCNLCPFKRFFGYDCEDDPSPFSEWIETNYSRQRKGPAKRCVEALQQVLIGVENEQ